jgi:hypothetical protein
MRGFETPSSQTAAAFNSVAVYPSWDILAGRELLGGSPGHLDIVGINYYWTNQWELGRPGVPLDSGDPRYCPLSVLLREVTERYDRPILITETREDLLQADVRGAAPG